MAEQMKEKVRAFLPALVIVGVFALCAWGVHTKEMTVTAALATGMAALTSAGILSSRKEEG